jgi:hypothetical protein
MDRNKLAMLLALDYIRNRIAKISMEISKMDVITDNIAIAFDERQHMKNIANVLDIKLGYLYDENVESLPGTALEDACLIFNGFLKRLENNG